MFNKVRSRNIIKVKYIIVLPMLIGMLFYSSCEMEAQGKAALPKNEKRFVTVHYGPKEPGEDIKSIKSTKLEGYFDHYFFHEGQPPGTEISYDDLTKEEKLEYDAYREGDWFNKAYTTTRIFVEENGRKSLLFDIDFKKAFRHNQAKSQEESESIPFGVMDQVPIFPDCEEQVDPKKCTTLYISLHVHKNFNSAISKDLDLEPGNKRVYVQFTIDKTGTITDVRARAPHERLEQEAIRVINTLPQLIPGEQKGKKVSVKYTLPITIKIE